MSIKLTADQQNAADAFMSFLINDTQSFFVIEGYSGCGKTTLVNYLIEVAENSCKFLKEITGESIKYSNIYLTATTHKAADTLQKSTKRPTSTIHSLLKLKVQHDYTNGTTKIVRTQASEMFYDALIFIDEASMADKALLDIIQKSTSNCKIVYIMDSKQLLPVFSKTVPLSDLQLPTVFLNQVVRQARDNPIISYAEQLRLAMNTSGPIPKLPICPEIQVMDDALFKEFLEYSYKNTNDISKFKILAWSNERVNQYNHFIRELLYPNEPLFTKGDKLVSNKVLDRNNEIIVKNEEIIELLNVTTLVSTSLNQEVWEFRANTSSGYQILFQPKDAYRFNQMKKEAKKHKDWYQYFVLEREYADFRHSYASTVHKAQGSTFETVFIDVDDILRNRKIDEVLRLLYVAITRASNNVILRSSSLSS